MSQATLTRATQQHIAAVFDNPAQQSYFKPRFSRSFTGSGAGLLKVSGLPVFRSGTFRDSMGIQHTWEPINIQDMARNFSMLRESNTFADVPVRDGHRGWIVSGMPGNGLVVGYHTGLSVEERQSPVDLANYHYLLGDMDIIDSNAQESINSGLWRSVSSEIGTYVTNTEAEHWPVYQGVAYVDIPAVEGLKGFSKDQRSVSVVNMEQGEPKVAPEPVAPPVTPPAEDADATAAAAAAQATADADAAAAAAAAEEPDEPAAADAPVEGQHGLNADGSFQFKIAGKPFGPVFAKGKMTGEMAAVFGGVQKQLSVYEQAGKDRVDLDRKAFVGALVKDNKLAASLMTQTEAFALSMTDEQFKDWSAIQTASPALSLLQSHGDGTSNHDGQDSDTQAKAADEISILKDTVKHHQRSNTSVEQIKETKSYKRLMVLEPTFTLDS